MANWADIIGEIKATAAKVDSSGEEEAETDFLKERREAAMLHLHIQTATQNNDLRREYSGYVLVIAVFWMGFIIRLIWNVGDGTLFISDNVLIAILTTTTANLLGLIILIIKYLFNPKKST